MQTTRIRAESRPFRARLLCASITLLIVMVAIVAHGAEVSFDQKIILNPDETVSLDLAAEHIVKTVVVGEARLEKWGCEIPGHEVYRNIKDERIYLIRTVCTKWEPGSSLDPYIPPPLPAITEETPPPELPPLWFLKKAE